MPCQHWTTPRRTCHDFSHASTFCSETITEVKVDQYQICRVTDSSALPGNLMGCKPEISLAMRPRAAGGYVANSPTAKRTTATPFNSTAPKSPIIQAFRLATSAFVAKCSSVVSTRASRSSIVAAVMKPPIPLPSGLHPPYHLLLVSHTLALHEAWRRDSP